MVQDDAQVRYSFGKSMGALFELSSAAQHTDVVHHSITQIQTGCRFAYQYGSRVKMNVVPVTIGALAPTNDTLTSLT